MLQTISKDNGANDSHLQLRAARASEIIGIPQEKINI